MTEKISSFGTSLNTDDNTEKMTLPCETGVEVDWENLLRKSFPPGFRFGAGSSAVQIEGGWNADGKGPSVWDTFCIENPKAIEDGSTTFVTCDSYTYWKEDVELLKEIGCNTYKFSLAWSRILPNGDLSEINEAGISYYNKLIDTLLLAGIEPMVVLWHFDLPNALAQKYTWKEEGIIPHFVNYANLCFDRFGDRVKRWLTINEPCIYTAVGWDLGLYPPRVNEPEAFYVLIHNMLLAHAQVYRLYEREFKGKQNGQIGISFEAFGIEPATDCVEDADAAQVAFEFRVGLIVSPLLFGKYPDCVREKVDRRSKAEGRDKSRLPIITQEVSKLMKGTLDFLGVNHYSCEKITASKDQIPEGAQIVNFSCSDSMNLHRDTEAFHYYDPNHVGSCVWWLKVTPPALRSLLNRIKNTYNNPEIVISEIGFPDKIERIEDRDRTNFFVGYLNETLKAVVLDGCNVTGFYAWGFLDGWEWTSGHNVTFGVCHVDLNSPEKTRTPRRSGKMLQKIYENHGFENFEKF